MKAAAMLGTIFSAGLLAAATPAIVEQQGGHVLVGGPVLSREVRYGPDERQAATLFTRVAAGRAPLIVYLHGGGWTAGTPKAGSGGLQPEHWTSLGYAYATVGYRLVPNVRVEEQLADVAQGIAVLRKNRAVDPDRIVLLGHSSGGHFAALLGTDPGYLERAGVPFGAVKGVVLLDPAALDIPPIVAMGGGSVDKYYRPTFGDDPARQSGLSPMKQADPPNAPAWLMVSDVNNGLAEAQSSELAAALIGAGAAAEVQGIPGTTHLRLNDEIGQPMNAATAGIDAFLRRGFPDMQRARRR